MTVYKSGLFIDLDSGRVVESPPVHGVQLAAPGIEVDTDAEAVIKRERAARADTKPAKGK